MSKRYTVSNNIAIPNNIFISLRCPHCGNTGNFDKVKDDLYDIPTGNIFGLRRCPDPSCHGHLFFVYNDSASVVLQTYPSENIRFDKSGIPDKILAAFEEAVICHSNNCFTASAIMIRKTLEEICIDRAATGSNLFKKLEDLGTKILIPRELLNGMQELRLLGNDAAHIEANAFNEIGRNEIEISIEFAKEILKAVYQYEGLLNKLRSLKKTI